MYMNMCIVMNMNIYIRPDLESLLRQEESMSGLINKLLEGHYSQTPHTPLQETIEEKLIPKNILEPETNLKTCCLRPSPCVHWNWNGIEEHYVNILTGEIRDLGEIRTE